MKILPLLKALATLGLLVVPGCDKPHYYAVTVRDRGGNVIHQGVSLGLPYVEQGTYRYVDCSDRYSVVGHTDGTVVVEPKGSWVNP